MYECAVLCWVDPTHRWNIHFMQLQAPSSQLYTGCQRLVQILHVVNQIQRLIECQFAWIAISFESVRVRTRACLSLSLCVCV